MPRRASLFPFKDFGGGSISSALAQAVPVPPRAPLIRSLPPAQASFGPTAVTAPPAHAPLQPKPEAAKPAPQAPRSRRKLWLGLGVSALAVAGIGIHLHHPTMKPEVVSGRAGPKLTASGVPERWRQSDLTVMVDESLSAVWPDATVGVETAFDTWRAADTKLPTIAFDARKPSQLLLEPDGENRVYYGPIPVAGHENDLAITLQYSNQESGEIVEADIIVNSRHPFAILGAAADHEIDASRKSTPGMVANCAAKYDVASVVTHEIGHFWGLGEDMVDTSATMYFSTPPCNVAKRLLKTDDVKAVSSLYAEAAPSASSSSVAHCSVTAVRQNPTNGASFAALVVVLGVSVWRKRRAPK